MTETNLDAYLAYVSSDQKESDLSIFKIEGLAEKQAKAEREVARLEAELEQAKADLRKIAEQELPELMDEVGLEDFKTKSGLKITVKETIRASITKANSSKAFAWLRSNNHASLIKRIVSTPFTTGEDEKASSLITTLKEQGFEFDDKESVHASTLSAFVREKLREGEEIPLELFSVHRQRATKVDI